MYIAPCLSFVMLSAWYLFGHAVMQMGSPLTCIRPPQQQLLPHGRPKDAHKTATILHSNYSSRALLAPPAASAAYSASTRSTSAAVPRKMGQRS